MESLRSFIDQLAPIPARLSFYDWACFCKDIVEESRKLKGKSAGKCSCHILSAGNQRPHSWCSVSLIRFLINYLEVNGRRQWWALLPFLLWHDHNDHAAEVNRTGKDPVLPLTDGTSGAQIRVSDDWCNLCFDSLGWKENTKNVESDRDGDRSTRCCRQARMSCTVNKQLLTKLSWYRYRYK